MSSKTYYAVPGVASVKWDDTNQLVLVVWEGWANTSEFTALLDAEVQALQEHRGSRLLADCRKQRVLNPADQERANRDWIPRAAEAGLRKFAIVLPLSDMAAAHIRQRTAETPPSAFEVAYFEDVDHALDWLRSGARGPE